MLPLALMVGTSLALAGGGCASRTYKAASLPPRFAAPRAQNLGSIDWTHLANYTVSSELIDRGDVLDVTIITDYANQTTTSAPVRILEDGTANIPLVGPVHLAGFELEEAERSIAAEAIARQVFRNPHVIVTMKRRRISRVRVVGAVQQPGLFDLPRGDSSLLAALTAAGGLADDAGLDVEIRRLGVGGPQQGTPLEQPGNVLTASATELISESGHRPPGPRTIQVNLTRVAEEGTGDVDLRDGDLVHVHSRPPRRVYVQGLIHEPGEYEIPPNEDMYLLNVLAKAGGRKVQAADRILIIRRIPGQEEPVRIEVSVAEAKRDAASNLRLASGDVISVEETPVTFVLETLQRFVRVGLSSSLPLF
jgi:polysaccharide export outer membrane protein